jgi:hypothetical protein
MGDVEQILGLIRHYDFHWAEWANHPNVEAEVRELVAQGCTEQDYTHAVDRWSGSTDPHDAWPVIRDHMPDCRDRRQQRERSN